MPDPERQDLPEPVLDQARKARGALDATRCSTRKPDSIKRPVHEIDVWADAGSLAAVGEALEAVGFTLFRSGTSGPHRFFLWYGEGWWVKVDVKFRHPVRLRLIADLLWLARRRRGAVVALLGADGAGKSTTASCVEASMPIDVQSVYLGNPKLPGPGGGRGRRDPSAIRRAAGLAKWLVKTELRSIGLAISARRGTVVICDRHPVEAGFIGDEPSIVKTVKRVLVRRLMPRPDLVILLAAPGDVVYQRKREHDPVTLDRMTASWRTVVEDFGGVEVDAAAPAQTVCDIVQQHIWDLVRERRRS